VCEEEEDESEKGKKKLAKVCRNWQRIEKGKRKTGIKNGKRWEGS